MIGQIVGGRYRILSSLGGGSFGQTYLAEDIHRPEFPQCVVKLLKPVVTNPSFLPLARNLFHKEAQTLERLGTHSQIPQLLAYFEQEENFYLVQEFVAGHTLRHELPPGQPWSEAQVVKLLREVLGVLVFVHECRVIHRDIKPDNLIRRQADQRLVLIDFGAVKVIQGGPGANPGTIAIGTPGYMPPEQSQGRPRPSSDLYALGMVALQALTGEGPSQLRFDEAGEVLWPPTPGFSPELVALVKRLVRYQPQDRYQSAAEALGALGHLRRPQLLTRLGRLLQTPVGELLGGHRPTPSFPVAPTMPRSPRTRVFISHQPLELEVGVAQEFYRTLEAAGYQPFISSMFATLAKDQWIAALEQCDHLILLLSAPSANSELLLEELRTVRGVQERLQRPRILPIRLNFPPGLPLNYEIRSYLQGVQQRFWRHSEDTKGLLEEILEVLASPLLAPETPTTGGTLSTVVPWETKGAAIPLPVAEPEIPQGYVNLASAFYIERPPIENQCYEAILQPGALIRIKAPRQMGKTSLMARILHQATQAGCRSVSLSLQLADGKVFTDLDWFLRWLCASLGRRLQLTNQIDQYWDGVFGSKYNCTAYFEEYILPQLQVPLALGLDEVDRVFAYPEIASDFFGLLRAWHEEAKNQELWQRLRLVVVHATEVYIPLDTNQSPFNVGLPLDLPEFNAAQVQELAKLHGLVWSLDQVQALMDLVGGHPYLVRLALYHLAQQNTTLQRLLQESPTEAGMYRDHLHGHLWNLQQHPELLRAFQRVVMDPAPVILDALPLFKLHSLGLVHLQGNRVKPRCHLYRQYFQQIFKATEAGE